MRTAVLVLVLLLLPAYSQASSNPYDCDRSGDYELTTVDALIALHDAVDTCRRTYTYDSTGDYEETAADALTLLRAAVSLPADLECSCTVYDECFEQLGDCINGYSPGYMCVYYMCVQCWYDEDCAEGEVGDRCSLTCVPPTTLPSADDECFTDEGCAGQHGGPHCCLNACSECDLSERCPPGFGCDTCSCVPLP